MRTIIASLFTTVDGVVEAPEKWHFPYFNDEMGAIVGSLMRDIQLLGRTNYETRAAVEEFYRMLEARQAVIGDQD